MNRPRILIVEDEHALGLALAAAVRRAGAEGHLVPSAARARDELRSGTPYAIMVLDIGLPDENGLSFLASLPAGERPPTVVVTAHGQIENAIESRKLGVVGFLPKPLDFEEFRETLQRALDSCADRSKVEPHLARSSAFIGAAAAMRPVFRQIAHSCASEDVVLVCGDTGTGKSHVASIISSQGVRPGAGGVVAAGPSLGPEDLGRILHDRSDGSLVIEEVSLLNEAAQAELVRQINAVESSGLPRLIATTRHDLRELVEKGLFRSDLLYRLQVMEVRLPALCQRMDDLPALVSYFLGELAPEREVEITPAALARLGNYSWPGNLRELRNAIAYALTVGPGLSAVDVGELPSYLLSENVERSGEEDRDLANALDGWLDQWFGDGAPPPYRSMAERLEAAMIRRLLLRYDGKLSRLANALGANRTTLRKRLRE